MSIENQTRLSELDAPFYFRSLIALARGDDGALDEKELAFLNAQAALQGCDIQSYLDETGNADSTLDLTRNSVSRETALSIIRDAITLCYINGEMSRPQKDVLYTFSRGLGIQDNEVDEVEDWLLRFWALIEEGNELFGASTQSRE